MTRTTTARALDKGELERRVKQMYQEVALEPEREFHFETGRPLAERLGYPPTELDQIPAEAVESFAGVGYFLDLAALGPGERCWTSAAALAQTAFSRPSRRPASLGST